MTRRRIAAVLLLTFTASTFAQTTQPTSQSTRPPAAPNSIGSAMKDMERAATALAKDAANPDKRDQSLHNVALMQRDAATAKLFIPPVIRKASADQKAKLMEDYRTDLVSLQKALLDLEDAIANKNTDAIQKSMDALQEIMKKGHGEFMPEN